jgi:hypothetical protein
VAKPVRQVPAIRAVQHVGLAVIVFIMLAYSASGLIFGYLPFFLVHFVVLTGVPAVLSSLGCAALALALATHLPLRIQAPGLERFRIHAYWAMATFWCLAVATGILAAGGKVVYSSPRPIAEDADWMLMPLPLLWRHFLPLGSDKATAWLFWAGVLVMIIGVLFSGLWVRVFLCATGMVMAMFGATLLGDASYQFAAARGLEGIFAPSLAADLRREPGHYNAWTFLYWWGGCGFVVFGVLVMALALLPGGSQWVEHQGD